MKDDGKLSCCCNQLLMDKPFAVDKTAVLNNKEQYSVPPAVCHVHMHDMVHVKE